MSRIFNCYHANTSCRPRRPGRLVLCCLLMQTAITPDRVLAGVTSQESPSMISGTVQDDAGHPIAAATVTASTPGIARRLPLKEIVLTATSDNDGHFQLEVPGPAFWKVTAEADGYRIGPNTAPRYVSTQQSATPTEAVVLVLDRPDDVRRAEALSKPKGKGIQPITAASFANARQNPPADDSSLRYSCISHTGLVGKIKSPYIVALETAAEAARRFTKVSIPYAAINAKKVTLVVEPIGSILEADAVEDVVIKRNGRVLRPLLKTVTPTTFRTAMGATRQLTVGRFTFDFSVFEPSTDIEIVMIGKAENTTCTITADELAELR
jgi:hypothetical protein